VRLFIFDRAVFPSARVVSLNSSGGVVCVLRPQFSIFCKFPISVFILKPLSGLLVSGRGFLFLAFNHFAQ